MGRKKTIVLSRLASVFLLLAACAVPGNEKPVDVTAPDAKVEMLADGFRFTEGPAADAKGDVYFTDIPNNRIHRWSVADRKCTVYREDSGGANGLIFHRDGRLFVCEGMLGRIVAIDPETGKSTVVADKHEGKPFNKPNDLWIDPKGGVYFTDPAYGYKNKPLPQGGENVYYVSPDRKSVKRVIDDMVRPNGVIGTPDGKLLYVADHGGKKTWRYSIGEDGSLSDKTLFFEIGSDGMALDEEGNLYLTGEHVTVHDPEGKLIQTIEIPKRPSNVCFGGPEGRTLFVTARDTFFSISMRVAVAKPPTGK